MIPGTFPELLAALAGLAAPALLDRGRPVSCAALAAERRRAARGLARLGVRAGDRVALWLPDVPAWLAAFLACAQLGAIALAVNTRFRSRELADILQRSRAKVLVFWPQFKELDFAARLAECAAGSLDALEAAVVYDESGEPAPPTVAGKPAIAYRALAGGAELAASGAAPGAGCAIFTTSGTTRAPKFVLHEQRTLIRHAFDAARGFGLGEDAVVLLAPPLCGVFGFCSAMAALAAGRPLVMRPAWEAQAAARDIAAHRVTHANGTDEAFARLLAVEGAAFASTRVFGYAAFNPAHAGIVARAEARGLRLVGLYGTSEIQALFARQDENASAGERAAAGGRPVSPLARVRARDPDSGRLLAHGEPGELELFAPSSRMAGYFGDPEATRAAFSADGWYRSGDLGHTLADGRFVFQARLGDSLRLAGFLVSPAEIEAVVQEAPGIAACQVVGVQREGAPAAVAFVILEPGASLNERSVIGHVGARLARHKVPARVFPIDAFPVTPGANATKIQKGRLREMAEALLN